MGRRPNEREDYTKVPPPELWPDSGKGKRGPTPLQRKYFIDRVHPDKRPHRHTFDLLLSVGGFGSGKCFRKGTQVLCFDGSITNVEDIEIGDLLMGPDSQPRKVIELARGREAMYKVTPVKGEPFYCNESHVLSLKRSVNQGDIKWVSSEGEVFRKPNPRYPGQEIVNISVKEYLGWSNRKKRVYMLYRSEALKFQEQELLVDPYILGLWLGDGSKDTFAITNVDEEIIEAWRQYGKLLGKEMVTIKQDKRAQLYKIQNEVWRLRNLGVFHNKHIPHSYKTSSIEQRKALLAGLIDSDGYRGNGVIEITQKIKVLAEDIMFVARSLGLACYMKKVQKSCMYKGEKKTGTYYKLSISGEMSDLPIRLERKRPAPRKQKKSVLITSFKLEKLPQEDYYGFSVDGDHLFLLGDFTVVHNSMGEVIRIVDTCLRVPGTNALIGGIDLQALKRNIIGIIAQIFTYKGKMWAHPAITNVLSDKQTQLKFANGSIISLVNLTDFLKVVGVTVGIMGVEEPHLLPNGEESFKTLVSRLRANKPDIRQMILCTNPETTTDGWMNRVFELNKLQDLDTSDGPAEMLVGKPCECQICISCKINYKKEVSWIKGKLAPDEKSIIQNDLAEDFYCPNCLVRKDFYMWKGEKFHCPGNQQYMRVLKSETMHNSHVPADVIQSMRDQYDDATFDIFVKGNVNKNLREDYVYTKFDEDFQFLEDLCPINWDEDLYWGLDFNRKPQSSVIAQFEDIKGKERFVTKAEVCLFGRPTIDNPYGAGGASAKDVAREFCKRYKSHYKGTTIHLFGDPKGFNKNSVSDQHNYEILAEHLEAEGFEVVIGATDNQIAIKDRIACVEHWLEDEFLLFNPKDILPWTHLSFKECKWDDKDFEGRQIDKKQDWNAARATSHKHARPVSHFNEALGYMVCSLFPLSPGDLRSATLPDGTTIREDRRGKVVVEKFTMDKAPEPGSWEALLTELKKKDEPGKAPESLKETLSISLRATQYPDDDGR